jgi:hypothetical protein
MEYLVYENLIIELVKKLLALQPTHMQKLNAAVILLANFLMQKLSKHHLQQQQQKV